MKQCGVSGFMQPFFKSPLPHNHAIPNKPDTSQPKTLAPRPGGIARTLLSTILGVSVTIITPVYSKMILLPNFNHALQLRGQTMSFYETAGLAQNSKARSQKKQNFTVKVRFAHIINKTEY